MTTTKEKYQKASQEPAEPRRPRGKGTSASGAPVQPPPPKNAVERADANVKAANRKYAASQARAEAKVRRDEVAGLKRQRARLAADLRKAKVAARNEIASIERLLRQGERETMRHLGKINLRLDILAGRGS